jgi:N-succinyldiaminopimelate aminotransferase
MPRHPKLSPTLERVGGSVYGALAHRLTIFDGETYPFHVGDTWMEPAESTRLETLTVASHPGMHRYTSVQGHPSLLDAIIARQTGRMGMPIERGQVLVTAGATGGLGAVVGAVVRPGDEVLILAPYWPLIAGIVHTFHGSAVPVPFFGAVEDASAAVAAVEDKRTDRTVALYVNTPHNPTGRIIPRPWLEALIAWARKRDLWIFADEVYEHYSYTAPHTYSRPLAPERTFSVHSFSKAFGMSGNRCGYVIGPQTVMSGVRKVSVHTFYSTPTASQIVAARALEGQADAWVADAFQMYRDVGRAAADRLGLPHPDGSTFLFVDVAERLDERGLNGFLEDAVSLGLLVAPGPSFGPYPTHIRVCFTATEPARTLRGVEVLAQLLGV